MVGVALGIGGIAAAGASIAGSSAQSSATKSASKEQEDAQKYAADIQQQMYNTTRGDLSPYNTIGQGAANQLSSLTLGQKQPTMSTVNYNPVSYTPVKMDEATLQQTPGYQFNLAQGLKSTQNSAAARGLGTSGAALKAASSYATGLADSTYQNQFANATTNAQNVYNANRANSDAQYTAGLNNSVNQYNSQVQNQSNAYNRLLGLAGLGESAAAQTGNAATATGQNIGNNAVSTGQSIGNNLIQGGNAQAGGYLGAANALNSGVSNYLQLNALKGIYGNSNYYPPAPSGGGLV